MINLTGMRGRMQGGIIYTRVNRSAVYYVINTYKKEGEGEGGALRNKTLSTKKKRLTTEIFPSERKLEMRSGREGGMLKDSSSASDATCHTLSDAVEIAKYRLSLITIHPASKKFDDRLTWCRVTRIGWGNKGVKTILYSQSHRRIRDLRLVMLYSTV